MTTSNASRLYARLFGRPDRGSVLIVALMLAAMIAISLVSFIKLCTTSLKLSHRSFFANSANNLVETGLEEAVWSFNQVGAGAAVATIWSSANGWTTSSSTVACVTVKTGGSGYTTAPTVSFSGGGGSGAVAIAIIAGGVVRDVKLTSVGSGYTSAPTVTFSGGGGTGATASTTNYSATRTLSTFNLDQNAIGVVKIFVAGYDGSYATPLVVAQATITPYDGGAPIVKFVEVMLKFNTFWANGVVAKNGIDWNGHPSADSWSSNPSGTVGGPWAAYPGTGVHSNTTVADFSGTISLGSQGEINGNLVLGSGATYGGSGTVTGTVTTGFPTFPTMPTYPTPASLSNYYNLGSSVPATLPRVIDVANAADGRYYYFAVGAAVGTSITAGKNVTIIGSGGTNISGTVNIPSTSSLIVYTDGTINGNFVNNAWAGALQLFTTTTAGTTINGNDNLKACIFAPNSELTGNGGGSSGDFYGSFVAKSVTSNGHMDFHYDELLAKMASAKPWSLTIWRELQTSSERVLHTTQLGF